MSLVDFAHHRVGGDQHHHAAETVGAHFRAGEGRNGGDVAQTRRAANDVPKDRLPAAVAEIELDLDIVGGDAREMLDDEGSRGAVDARLRECRFEPGPVEPDPLGRAFVGIKIKPFALALRVRPNFLLSAGTGL